MRTTAQATAIRMGEDFFAVSAMVVPPYCGLISMGCAG
jgi:hypothetical protein